MTISHVRRIPERATLSDAQEAFFKGAFEACLAACDAIVAREESTRFELALLRARALLRLDRADRAIEALRACAYTPTSLDGLLTAEMLLGAAYVRLGQCERGEGLLAGAHARARDAHPGVGGELALNLGIARYLMGRFDDAEALLATVPSSADIIFARALEYRGVVALARGRFEVAAGWYREALECIERCRWHDRFVEANVLYGLVVLSTEMLETAGWDAIERRVTAFDWSLDGLARPRFWIAVYCSMMVEVLGDETRARAWARRAEEHALSPAYRAIALCRTAGIFRGLGERRAHLEFATRALEIYDAIDARELAPDQKQAPLFIAEELASAGAYAAAAGLVSRYRETIAPTVRVAPGDDRYLAQSHTVDAYLHQARGDRNAAVRSFAQALELCRKGRYRRQAAAVAFRLARLTGARRYARYAAIILKGADPRYWMAAEAARMAQDAAPALTDNQRAILALVAQGKTYKEIGATLRRSWKTVNNSVENLRAKFGVGTRGELVAEAMRRGLVDVGARADDSKIA